MVLTFTFKIMCVCVCGCVLRWVSVVTDLYSQLQSDILHDPPTSICIRRNSARTTSLLYT